MPIRSALRCSVALAISNCLLVAQLPARETLRLRWDDLGAMIDGKTVSLELQDAIRVVGRVQRVEPTAVRVEVTKTSDRRTYPIGLAAIPRQSVSAIEVNKPAGHKGLIIGGLVGGGIAAVAGGVLVAQRSNEGGTGGDGPIAGAIVGPLGIGLLIGQLIDSAHRGAQRITIVNE